MGSRRALASDSLILETSRRIVLQPDFVTWRHGRLDA
jgi:hypothetical protein